MSDLTASPDTTTDLLGAIPGGLGAMLSQARAALEQAQEPNADVQRVAEGLADVTARLDVVATNLELSLEMFARIAAGFNALAGNVDALTQAAAKPIARLGLILQPVPKV